MGRCDVTARGQQSETIPPIPPGELSSAPRLGVLDADLPDVERVKAVAVTPAHADFATSEQSYISHYIGLADTKAAWAFTIASGAIAYLISKDGVHTQLTAPAFTPAFVILVSPILLLSVSAGCSFLAIVPRHWTSGEGLVSYSNVAQHRNAASYVSNVARKSSGELTELRLAHCFDIARVCARKYGYLRKAMWLGVAGLAAAVVPLITYG